ncbi:MAG: ABC transporter ATP-binding protein [Anaerolineaceae bacterium]|nr:ABC transporter ATP-binding protein [Anaerolineaceae bacterium]
MSLLAVESLCMYFGGLKAVDKISFSVEEGEIFTIIGPNGAGKTTVFNVLTGFLKPTAGKAIFLEKEIQGQKPHQIANYGLTRTYQHTSVFQKLSVLDNALIGSHRNLTNSALDTLLHTRSWKGNEASAKKEALEVLGFLGIADHTDTIAANLVHGQLRLLELAIALCSKPKLLLLDEPATGMNPEEALKLMNLIYKIRDLGITIMLVEHNMSVVMSISDRVMAMNFGTELALGKPKEVANNEEVIAAYLGGGFKC